MEIIDNVFRGIWAFCGVIGFVCISCAIGFTIIAVADNIKYKEIEKNIKRFKGETDDISKL